MFIFAIQTFEALHFTTMKAKISIFILTIFTLLISSCIKDDFIDDSMEPIIRITNAIDTIAIDSNYQFEFLYLNNIGAEEMVNATWESSDEEAISISTDGLASASVLGSSMISVSYFDGNNTVTHSKEVHVGQSNVLTNTAKSGSIATTSSYALTGDFTVTQVDNDLLIEFESNYNASTSLPGLYLYLSNNTSTITDAYEVGAVTVFEGVHSYTIPDTDINDYSHLLYFCKPFNVKVGDGQIQ